MEDFTLQLVKLALNMHLTTQQVAAQNIAKNGLSNHSQVDFSSLLEQIKSTPDEQKLTLVEQLNNGGVAGLQHFINLTDESVNIEKSHANSTKAVLEYQTLVEALNRKMAIKSLVYGGRS